MVRKKGEEKAVPLVLKIPIPSFYQMCSTLYTKKFGIIYHLQSWEPDGGFTQKCFLFIIRQSCVADVCFVIKEAFVEGAYPASADNWAFFHWPKKPPGWMRVEKFRVRSSLANWFFGQYWKAAPLVPPSSKDRLLHSVLKSPKMSHLNFELWHFRSIFVILKVVCLVTLLDW